MEIKILGPGCPRCQQTEKIVREAVAEACVETQIEKITDTIKIAGYGGIWHTVGGYRRRGKERW